VKVEFFILTLIAAAAVIAALFFILRRRYERRGAVQRSLNLGLLAVRFPNQPPADIPIQQLREKIALMEQCYAHLASIRDTIWWAPLLYGRPAFALELNIPSVGEELVFYIAVGRRFLPAVEKAIQGIFPDTHIERAEDYNIFAPDGAAAGAV